MLRKKKRRFLRCFRFLMERCVVLKRKMNSKDVEQALLAMGWVGWRKKAHFLSITQHAKILGPSQFSTQEICNVLQTCAKLGVYDKELIQVFLEGAKMRLDDLDQQGLALFMRQVKDLRYYDEELMQIVSQTIQTNQLNDINWENAWMIISAFSAFYIQQTDVRHAVSKLQRNLPQIQIKNNRYMIGVLCDHVLNLSTLGIDLHISHFILQQLEEFTKDKNQDLYHPDFYKLQQAKQFYAFENLHLEIPPTLENASSISVVTKSNGTTNSKTAQLMKINEKVYEAIYQHFQEIEDVLVGKQFLLQEAGLFVDVSVVHVVQQQVVGEQTDQNQNEVQVKKKIAVQVEREDFWTLNQPYYLLAQRQKLQQILIQNGWYLIVVPFYQFQGEESCKILVENVMEILQS
eukprot:TRINITY_DN12024_c0_g1_i2.p1 TRINITY_DN12024_c0_g1~~TRINITY_DN12024_c0_g1_i2.p1  ORF type:complete len:404 (-),score=41.68 TRINITY_DN12024_c0_g1_i2:76-1287(-)